MATDVAEERGRSGRLGADGASGLGTSEPPSQAGAAEKMEVDTRADARCLTLGRVLWSLALCVPCVLWHSLRSVALLEDAYQVPCSAPQLGDE